MFFFGFWPGKIRLYRVCLAVFAETRMKPHSGAPEAGSAKDFVRDRE